MSYMPVIIDLDRRIKYGKERRFTGVLSVAAESKAPWNLYFLVGEIVWASNRIHTQRRWHRQLLQHCPELLKQNASSDLSYSSLAKLVIHKKFSRERFSKLVEGCIAEILFDIIQQGTLQFQSSRKLLTSKAIPRDADKFPCISLQCFQVWGRVQQDWKTWEQSNLTDVLPNQAPVIVQSTDLRERTSLTMFRALTGLVDGQQTLRDLALRVNQPLAPLTLSILPHIRKGFIRMVDIDDLSSHVVAASNSPVSHPTLSNSPIQTQTAIKSEDLILKASSPKTPINLTVLYIDDSPTDSQTMAQIINSAGYRYVNIADPLQALPKLLELKPQLIFLDLVMPFANGYELCAQIRRMSAFRETPIVIVTNNDGIADRVRAKMVGASGFLGKPIRQKRVLKVLQKYIPGDEDTVSSAQQHSRLSSSV